MSEMLPWRHHRISREGILEILEPGIPLRRKLGAFAVAGASLIGLALQADVSYSDFVTPNVAPSVVRADKTLDCHAARALIIVKGGYGIQNSEYTAARIASIANEQKMSTYWVNNGTAINIAAVGDEEIALADECGVDQIIEVGESVGGIEAALTRNYIIEKVGDRISFPGMLLDSTPGGKDTLKWVNRTLAEQVAENCQFFKLGDVTMTAITLLTDQKDERRLQPWKYWNDVYGGTRSASMRLRTGQSCMAGQGFPELNKTVPTHVFYARSKNPYRDPIVDVDMSEEDIEARSNGMFEPVYMDGDGISHAAPWDNWAAYEPHYRDVLKQIGAIIVGRELETWYRKNPHLPQPK